MNWSIMISICGFVIVISMLIRLNYRIESDIVVCKNCPYTQSTACWECRRKSNIKKNKYNVKK